MATTPLPAPPAMVLINPPGLLVPAPYKKMQFKHVQLAFQNPKSPTEMETDSFNKARTYICLGKSKIFSTSDISAIIPLKELTHVGVCKHVVPQIFKAATDNTHVIIITVDDSISNESAKELIAILTWQLNTPTYRLDGFNDIDTAGQITINSRKDIDIVVYFHKQARHQEAS